MSGSGRIEAFQELLARGLDLEEQSDLEEGLAFYRSALEQWEDPVERSALWQGIGRLQLRGCVFTEAEAALAQAVALTPDDPLALCRWGITLHCLSRHQDAQVAYERAVKIDPGCDRARLSLGLHYLLHGRYAEGWPHYRRRLPLLGISVPDCLELWDGQESVPELLVVAEQGIGDVMQFSRYAPLLQLASPLVTFVGETKVHALLAQAGLFQRFRGTGEPFSTEPGARWLPLMALPELMAITPGQVILDAPYLRPDPRQLEEWALRFGTGERLRVGIGWQGNPLAERDGLAGRSLPLECLAPLAALEGVELVSLQKGPGAEQQEACSFRERFSPLQPEVDRTWDLLETLAILEQCDVVISTDTALAHMAAALGRPTWILLQAVPDWRWGLEGETTPWYPCARLFRQQAIGDWGQVVDAVREALLAEIQSAHDFKTKHPSSV
jgi:tetratricopeptide (TPR) repeat protein